MKKFFSGVMTVFTIVMTSCVKAPEMPVITGEIFPDTEGNHINAHGGSIMEDNGVFYWYGEHRGDGTKGSYQQGVTCYTSNDLKNWENRGLVLKVTDKPGDALELGCIIERPKVVRCNATGKYVMWFHHELKGMGYGSAHAAVATSDSPLGPFMLLHTGRVNPGIYPQGTTEDDKSQTWDDTEWWTPEWRQEIEQGKFNHRDIEGGQMSRDMTIFIDDDGTAYHIYSSESNLTLQIAELDTTYTKHTGKYIRVLPGGHNEAPALFKHNGTYWMITSGCTGWAPNAARLLRADSITGEWEQLPNPCQGNNADITFGGQGTYVFDNNGRPMFMADVWNPKKLCDSRHLWLPIHFSDEGVPYITMPQSQPNE